MSTQLRDMFHGAADSEVPFDLAERAMSGARQRRRNRLAVGGAVLAAAAVVLGFVVVNSSERLDGAPRPDEVAGLPDQLPAPIGLPRLTADTMSFASAAYVVDGQVVVLDAATGDGATVRLSCRAGYVCGVVPGIGSDASVAMSPNGQFLLVSSGKTDLEPGGREWVWLVDVATGVATPQTFKLAPSSEANAEVLQTRMAWSPTGQRFACICSGPGRAQLWTADMAGVDADLVVSSVSGTDVSPTQISWGTGGLVARLPELGGDWRRVPLGDASMADPKEWPTISSVLAPESIDLMVTAVVMGQSPQGGFLGEMKGGRAYWIVNDVR
ncbi:MAG: hypothetical protein ABI720_13205, partial [Actinomycetes bacterium]